MYNKLQIEETILFIILASVIFMFFAGASKSEGVTSHSPCEVLVVTTQDGKTILREPREMDYAFCIAGAKEETSRIPKTNRIFGKKCHKR